MKCLSYNDFEYIESIIDRKLSINNIDDEDFKQDLLLMFCEKIKNGLILNCERSIYVNRKIDQSLDKYKRHIVRGPEILPIDTLIDDTQIDKLIDDLCDDELYDHLIKYINQIYPNKYAKAFMESTSNYVEIAKRFKVTVEAVRTPINKMLRKCREYVAITDKANKYHEHIESIPLNIEDELVQFSNGGKLYKPIIFEDNIPYVMYYINNDVYYISLIHPEYYNYTKYKILPANDNGYIGTYLTQKINGIFMYQHLRKEWCNVDYKDHPLTFTCNNYFNLKHVKKLNK